MRVFVTGASGYIGSAVVPALINAGHEVVGLSRSDESAAKIAAMGASVARGGLSDLDVLASAAVEADATVHLAFDHETMMAGDFAGAVSKDLAVACAIGDALVGTDKIFIGIGLGSAATQNPRGEVANAISGYASRGVRAVLVAVANSTHSDRDKHGFIPLMIGIARETGVSGYIGDGTNHWPPATSMTSPSCTSERLRKHRPERSWSRPASRQSRCAPSPSRSDDTSTCQREASTRHTSPRSPSPGWTLSYRMNRRASYSTGRRPARRCSKISTRVTTSHSSSED
jgi:hypothetical protein